MCLLIHRNQCFSHCRTWLESFYYVLTISLRLKWCWNCTVIHQNCSLELFSSITKLDSSTRFVPKRSSQLFGGISLFNVLQLDMRVSLQYSQVMYSLLNIRNMCIHKYRSAKNDWSNKETLTTNFLIPRDQHLENLTIQDSWGRYSSTWNLLGCQDPTHTTYKPETAGEEVRIGE